VTGSSTDPWEGIHPLLPPEFAGPAELAGSTGRMPPAAALLDALTREGGEALRKLGFRERLRIVARAGARFLDPADPLRREALERLPADAALSADESARVLDGMARDWTLERLSSAVRADFPDPDVLDGFRPGPRGERHRVVPPRLLVQVCAGNVPGTGATALLRGLLVGAPTLLKPGVGDRVLPELLGRALQEEAGGGPGSLSRGFAVAGWAGGRGGELERAALARADRVVVYGGSEAVAAVRAAAGPLTPVVVYGPRVSIGVVLADAVGHSRVVEAAARAVAAYEQRGCVSPHIVWVEEGGKRSPHAWAEALAGALERLAPAPGPRTGTVDPDLPEIPFAAMRGLAEAAAYRAASGTGDGVFGGPQRGWMVLWEPGDRPFEPSCLGRTVRVRPLPSIEGLGPRLEAARGVLQSAAVEGTDAGRTHAALLLARSGVTRVTTFERQPWPPAWWRHDGEGPLRALVRWVALEPDAR
jgi:hypothetical protein